MEDEQTPIDIVEINSKEMEGCHPYLATWLTDLLKLNSKIYNVPNLETNDLEIMAKANRNYVLDRDEQDSIEDGINAKYHEYCTKIKKRKAGFDTDGKQKPYEQIKLVPDDEQHAMRLAILDSIGLHVQYFKPNYHLDGYRKSIAIIGTQETDGRILSDMECLTKDEKKTLIEIIEKMKKANSDPIDRLHNKYGKKEIQNVPGPTVADVNPTA